jgi:tyrosine-protein kinase
MHRIDKRLVSVTAPSSMEAEQYQALRLRIERLQAVRDLKVLAITSPGAKEGKTVTAINLAGALARGSNTRVLLIEADVRRPAIGRYLRIDVDARTTFAQAIANPDAMIDVGDRPETLGFDLMLAGTADRPIHELFRSAQLPRVIAQMRERYDYVLLDTPPIGPVSDCALLARYIDGLLLVVSAHKTPRQMLEAALNQLDPQVVVGLVFNGDKRPLFGYRNSYYKGYFPSQQAH